MERSVLNGLAVYRWVAWVWMATVLVLARGALERPVVAAGLVLAALAVTIGTTRLLRRDPDRLRSPGVVGVEVGVALALQLADGFVYRAPHVFEPEQPLGVAWPIAGVLAAGVAFGPVAGAATGVLMGAGRAVSSIANLGPAADGTFAALTPAQTLSLVTTTVMYAVAGGVGGYAVGLVRRAEERVTAAERRVAEVRAREQVARRLHDGVLQTLALVERRADDPQLSALARDQERDLRAFLFGGHDPPVVGAGALGDALRDAAGRFEARYGARAQVLVPDDLPDLAPDRVEALAAAVGEALTNAGKHGRAGHVVVYVEPADGSVFCSVRDDGQGFDLATVVEGVGLARSIRGRVEEFGGRVEVVSASGHGAEVRITLPAG